MFFDEEGLILGRKEKILVGVLYQTANKTHKMSFRPLGGIFLELSKISL